MKIEGIRFDTAWKKRKVSFYDRQKTYILDRISLIKNKRKLARPLDLADAEKLEKVGRYLKKGVHLRLRPKKS